MPSGNAFSPKWTSAPGETIADILRERKISTVEFAQRMETTYEAATELLQGRATITLGIARKLAQFLGSTVEFWMSRDFHYREDSARLLSNDAQWLAELPLGDMIKFGWLRPVPRPSDEMSASLSFFNVGSVPEWRQTYAELQDVVAFRTSPSFDSRPAAVAAWLRQSEIESEAIKCDDWDAKRFAECLSSIRALTRQKDPKRFIPELQKTCAAFGVAVVVLRAPTGCRASGATRFLSEKKALLLLSFRHLSDDQFWFSFFHESAHLLLHSERSLFLEGVGASVTQQEEEANEYAGRVLIPSDYRSAMFNLPAEGRAVIRFARRVGVCPGIVVGQLQHYGKIGRNQLNVLKRRFRWNDSSG